MAEAGDVAITAANVIAGTTGRVATGVLGEAAMTSGMLVYADSGDSNRLKKTDAADSAKATAVGMLLSGGGIGQPCSYLVAGDVALGAVLSVGEQYYVSTTVGLLMKASDLSSGEYVTLIGIADSTTNLVMSLLVSGVQIP